MDERFNKQLTLQYLRLFQNTIVGKTPLIYLEKYSIYAKVERNNPTGSVKDRPVYFMVLKALKVWFNKS